MSIDKPEQPETVAPEADVAEPTKIGEGEDLGTSTGDYQVSAADKQEVLDTQAEFEAELTEARDTALRAQADAINAQRRAEQEIEKARKFALERFCGDLLSVVDNLERALDSAGEDSTSSALFEGVELTRKGFIDLLGKYGVETVNPLGEPFDPETAQAMSMLEQPNAEPNSVVAVMQKGYTLNGRLLRPAMVMVAKAPA